MQRIFILFLLFNTILLPVIMAQAEHAQPPQIEEQTASDAIMYVQFKLKNNTSTRKHFYVRGPRERRFSYGFPIGAQQKRKENWPVGTKVFQEGKLGQRKLLYTVQVTDEGKVIALFSAEK